MMRKLDKGWRFGIVVAAVIAVALPSVAWAGKYGMAGCGLGSMLFGDKPGMVQVLAATTNGSFASQTFGITSGTSNCTEGGTVAKAKEQEAFVEVNYTQLERDTAMGGGEYLSAFATLLGCSVEAHNELGIKAQAHHDTLFGQQRSPADVVAGFRSVIDQDPSLARQCGAL